MQKIASVFDLELRFRVTINPDGSITRIVDLLKPDSVFDGKEIVFGKDMTGIRRKENTENICTRLVGIGPADEDGNIVTFASVNGGKIYVEDEEAYQRWNNAGRHIWGIFEYQPEGDTEVTPQQLLDATKKEMEKRKNSAVEWEVSAAALEQIPRLEHERVRVGMNVRIKDEAFDPPIYLEARVLETEMPELDDPNGNFSYTFGNYRQVTVVIPPEVKAIQKTLFQKANAWTAAKSIAAQALADAAKAQATADGKITSFYQPDPPATASEGDLWFDTDDGNKPYVWQNGQWVNAQDSGIAEALNRANDAQATADKKVQTFFSETQPTAEGIGDLWYNPASGALFRWSGSAWELVSDVTSRNTAADTAKVGGKPSITVLNDITVAQQTANQAKQIADNSVQKGTLYNGVSISETDGFKVARSDQLVQGVFNAMDGIRFQTRPDTASAWQDDFYYDVNTKRFKFAGELEGASGTFGQVTVKNGDFTIQVDASGVQYSAILLPNLIKDHSFETVAYNSNTLNVTYRWANAINPYIGGYANSPWYITGSPKVTFQLGPDPETHLPIFGKQAVCVSSGNYFRQFIRVAPNATYTLSAFVKRQANATSGGTLRLEVWEAALLDNRRVRQIVAQTFPAVKSDYTVERRALTFTASLSDPENLVEVVITGGNSYWVQVDGVQLVQANKPSVYNPEDSTFAIIRGDQKILFEHGRLWSGMHYINANQTIYPEKKIRDCPNEWILVWSDYDPGVGANDYDIVYSFIPKEHVGNFNGSGVHCIVSTGRDGTIASKYVYIYNDKIVGNNANQNAPLNDVCLRYVLEW